MIHPRALALLAILITAALTTGCSTTNSGFRRPDLTKIAIGMTKTEVIDLLGQPDEVAAQQATEYLIYGYDSPFDGRIGRNATYFVRFAAGRVEAFGKEGDFDSTKSPTLNVNIDHQP